MFFCKERLGGMTNYRIVWIAGVVFVLAGSALSAQEKAPAAEEMGHGMAHGMPREATPGTRPHTW